MSQAENVKPSGEGTSSEVVVKAHPRRYTAEYKLRILQETEACSRPGEIGAILRREGLYSQILGKWRDQRKSGSLASLSEHRRGPKVDERDVELARLQRENKRLLEKLKRAELIMDVQKKVAQMLGVTLTETNLDEEA